MIVPLDDGFRSWPLIEYLGVLWPDRTHKSLEGLFAKERLWSGSRPAGQRHKVGEIAELELRGDIDDVPHIYLGESAATNLEILHEDDRLVVVAKPSGLPVVPDRQNAQGSVLGFLIRRELAGRGTKPSSAWIRPRIVHRIDRLTSGLVIAARTPDAERKLAADFEHRRIRKSYLALLDGVVRPARCTVNCPVVPGRKGKMRAELAQGADEAKGSALSEFDVLERFAAHTLVCAKPRTGRTHQLRVHAWAAGHPLAVDPVYGVRRAAPAPALAPLWPERLTLHAFRYELPDDWEEPRVFECPVPDDLTRAISALRDAGA